MKLAEMTSFEVDKLSRDIVVLLPVAALEQHSRHLPVFTDSILCGTIAEAVEANLPKDVLLLPVLWTGASSHHLDFAGTVSIELDTYVEMLCQILRSLLEHGFKKAFILNGHGGNLDPIQVALRLLSREYPQANLAGGNYWFIAGDSIANILTGPRKVVGHACEMETSGIMAVRPDLVRKTLIRDDPQQDDPRLVGTFVPYDMKRHTKRGGIGHATQASAAKGKRLMAAIIADVTAVVKATRQGATRGPGTSRKKEK